MALYDVTGHPLLSEEAAALGPTELEAHTRVAVSLLKLDTFPAFNAATQPDQYAQANNALALQVSYQVEAGIDAFITAEMLTGARRATYRGKNRMPPTHGIAKKLAVMLRPKDTSVTR